MKAKEPKYEIKVRVTQAQLDRIHGNMRIVHLENRGLIVKSSWTLE